jgi:predicted dienelactone hydrolase
MTEPLAWPRPSGPHAAGLLEFELTDSTRMAALAPQITPHRTLKVMAWYPASSVEGCLPRHYLQPREADPTLESVLSMFHASADVYDALQALETSSFAGAAPAAGSHPLLVFCHGLMSYPHQNTLLMEHLASHGYVVLSLGRPYESGGHVLSDGTVVPLSPAFQAERSTFYRPEALAAYLAPTLEERRRAVPGTLRVVRHTWPGRLSHTWADDAIFAVDCIEDGRLPANAAFLKDVCDFTRLGYFGMSYGGHVAALCSMKDPRTGAGANLDGGFFSADVVGREVGAPFLAFTGDGLDAQLPASSVSSSGKLNAQELAYQRFDGTPPVQPVHRIRLRGSLHGDFTDLPLLLHGRMTVPGFLSGLDPERLIAAQLDTVRSFFDAYVGVGDEFFPGGLVARHAHMLEIVEGGPARSV